MKFTKMQGLGNDYVYVNGFQENIEDPGRLSKRVSDRHFGIGSDGLILIQPSGRADFAMEMYNADGSQGAMCGNGIRCVGKYVYDHGMTDKTELSIETKSGIKYLELSLKDGKVDAVKVNMGAPGLKAAEIPFLTDREEAVFEPLEVGGKIWNVTAVSMGNPHAVVYVEELNGLDLAKIGPGFENHPRFPDRVNTEFVHVLDRGTVEMRVWERGSGETYACGTGACATAVSSIVNGLTGEHVKVKLLGGELEIFWDRKENLVYMTGPAVTVFEGEIEIR